MACHRSLRGERERDESPGLLLHWSSLFLSLFLFVSLSSLFLPSGLHCFTPFFVSLYFLWFSNSQWQSRKLWFSDHRGMREISVSAPWQPNKYCHGMVVNSASVVPDNLTCFFISVRLVPGRVLDKWNEKRQGNPLVLKIICMEIREMIFVYIDPICAC